jgi:hypothetical protein
MTANNAERKYWGIMRTGHIYESFYGTRAEAEEYVRRENAAEGSDYSEILTKGMTLEEFYQWFEDMQGK